jgi:uncharacterized protein (DUF1015 family)
MPGVTASGTRSTPPRPQPGDGLVLAPFRGVRYNPARVRDLADVTAPPYDVIDADEQARLETADPHNIVRLILPSPSAGDERYAAAATRLAAWRASGVLVTDPRAALYVYEQAGSTPQRGLVGALALRTPEEGVVLPHEDVRPEIVADRLALMKATAANLEPILLQYDGGGALAELVDAAARADPVVDAVSHDGARHRLWRLDGADRLGAVQADLRTRQALIADGHHRYAAYLQLQAIHRGAGDGAGPWDYGLALLVDADSHPLRMQAIHRVLPGMSAPDMVERLDRVARVAEVSHRPLQANLRALESASGPAYLVVDANRQWLVSELDRTLIDNCVPGEPPEAWRWLDATVLHHVLLGRLWGVPDRIDTVAYHHSVSSAVRAAERSRGAAILLRPAPVETVAELARQRVRMPRKSTSFGPKPRSGLVLRLFAAE